MSDYLSQLARASGLPVGRRPAAPARDARRVTHNDAAPSTSDEPPHVERVTFVGGTRGESPLDASDSIGARRVGALDHEVGDAQGSARHYARRVGGDTDDARPDTRGDAARTREGVERDLVSRDDTTRGARASASGGVVELDGAGETGRDSSTRAAHTESISDGAEREGARASGEGGDGVRAGAAVETTVVVGPRGGVDESGAGRRPSRADASGADSLDSPDSEAARRTYLREIVEWISAPSPVREGDEEARAASDVMETRFSRLESAARARAESQRGPEADDVTLSIGSIHVVVEEPPAQAHARPAPTPPAAESHSRAGDGGEGSRLRRHYIRL